MKHKQLLFVASMLVSNATFAQWTKPADPTFVQPELDAEYYLYNKDAGAFFCGMGEWGTRAGVETMRGEKVKIRMAINSVLGELDAEEWDGETYVFQDSIARLKRFDEVWFGADASTIWVDRQSNAAANLNYVWNFVPQDNGAYRIKASEYADDYQADQVDGWLGLVPSKGDNSCYFCTESRFPGETLQVDWYFITPDAYEAYIPAMNLYGAAMNLKAAIDEAKEECPGIVLTDAEAVFNNTESTPEELTEAIKLIDAAVLEYNKVHASVEKPADVSGAIKNPDFNSGNAGWKGDSPSWGYGAVEFYNRNFNVHQTVTGLNPGIYRVGVQGFYRAGEPGVEYELYTENPTKDSHAVFYVNTSTGTMTNKVMRIMEDAVSAPYGGDESAVGDKFIPHSMAATIKYFDSGLYKNNFVYACVGENGEITFGLKKDVTLAADWVMFDNWSLYYYGDSDDAYTMWRDETVKTLPTIGVGEEDRFKASYKEDYDNALAVMSAATSKEDILTAIPAVVASVDALQTNMATYEAYAEALKEAELYFEEHPNLGGEDVERINWYFVNEDGPDADYPNGGAKYILDNCPLSTEELIAEMEFLAAMKLDAINNGMSNGADCTERIINANFSDPSGKGWQNPDGVKLTGGLASYPCAEAFEKAFDVYQDIEISNGLYEVSVNAFYRPAANDEYDGTEPVPAEIYLNEFATPVQHIMSDCAEYPAYTPGDWQDDYETAEGWVPNSMNGASKAFEAGRYKQTVYGLVTDGKLRLGIRSTATEGAARWCLWTNFKLIYRAKDPTALASVINDVVDVAAALFEEEMYEADKEALEEAINLAQEAVGGDDMYDALIKLNASIITARASIKARVDIEKAISDLAEAIDMYEETASAEAMKIATALADEISTEKDNYIADIANAKIAEVKNAITRLKVPNGANASDENPIDFTVVIVNPAFDQGNADGWDYSSFVTPSKGYKPGVFTNPETGVTLDKSVEAWKYNTALENAEVVQHLAYLPNGAYSLEVDAFATNQALENIEHEGVCLFAQEGDNVVLEHIKTIGEVPSHFMLYFVKENTDEPLSIGIRTIDTSANWFVADNFKLTYYGTDSEVGIEDVVTSGAEVVAVEYYTLGGIRVATPQKGVNIVKATLSDGTVKVSKVIF